MTVTGSMGGAPLDTGRRLLREAEDLEQAGRTAEAVASYRSVISIAEQHGQWPQLATALRRLAVQVHHRGDSEAARDLCVRSLAVARRAGDQRLAAEALNTLGGVHLSAGDLQEARSVFLQALQVGAGPELGARVEQNLGILANIEGDLDEAQRRYRSSLAAYVRAGNTHGCAIAYNNLGMVNADRGKLADAEDHFRTALRLAARVGDAHLQGLCLVNRAELEVTLQRYENARQSAEEALALFQDLGSHAATVDCHRVLGMIYRETGRSELGASHLESALTIAVASGSLLAEAEAAHEMALLCQSVGRNLEALRHLNRAHGLFGRLDARRDLMHVRGLMAELEATYLAVVQAWGRSIEAADPTTFGHCERVARTSVAVARALGLSEEEETAILFGAYLHDVGLVHVPPEIMAKAPPLTSEEIAALRAHPVHGVALLQDVDFPWDIKPIIRWHHERQDGTGYPDGLRGDQIPLSAQVVGIAEAYDAVIAPRGGRRGLPPQRARIRVAVTRGRWSPRVIEAFLRATRSSPDAAPPPGA